MIYLFQSLWTYHLFLELSCTPHSPLYNPCALVEVRLDQIPLVTGLVYLSVMIMILFTAVHFHVQNYLVVTLTQMKLFLIVHYDRVLTPYLTLFIQVVHHLLLLAPSLHRNHA